MALAPVIMKKTSNKVWTEYNEKSTENNEKSTEYNEESTKYNGINTEYNGIKVCIRAKWPIRPDLIPVSVAWSDWEYFYSPLDGMLVHRRVTPPALNSPVPIYTPGWKEAPWE